MSAGRGETCVVLGIFGSLALIASGLCGDNGFDHSMTALALVGVCLYAAAAAIWWRAA